MVFRRRTANRKAGVKRKFARRVAPKRRVGARKSMVSLIKSVIAKQAENKRISWATITAPQAFGGTNYNTQNIIPMSPYSTFMGLAQGTTTASRIGNKVTTRSLKFRFVLYAKPYDVTTNSVPTPQIVTFYFVKCKDEPVSLTSSSALGNFFQSGSSSQSPLANLFDDIREVNLDAWTVCKKMTMKIGGANNASVWGASGFPSNNDFSLSVRRTVDLTKFVNKTVLYNDNNTTPTTPTLQLIILTANADGTGAPSAGTIPMNMFWETVYEFEDM